MVRNTTHVVRGVAAVIDGAHISGGSDVWVDDGKVTEALEQFKKLSERNYPDIKVYTGKDDRDRVALKLR